MKLVGGRSQLLRVHWIGALCNLTALVREHYVLMFHQRAAVARASQYFMAWRSQPARRSAGLRVGTSEGLVKLANE
jgi:hypothetical protein